MKAPPSLRGEINSKVRSRHIGVGIMVCMFNNFIFPYLVAVAFWLLAVATREHQQTNHKTHIVTIYIYICISSI